MAAPSREPACVMPCAKPRSAGSIQRDSERVAMGNAPDSPTPKMKRMATMDAAFQAKVVREVNILHQVTIIASARRGPILSPNQAPGSWKSVKPTAVTGEDPAGGDERKAEFFADEGHGRRDDGAVHVGDHVDRDGKGEDDVPGAGGVPRWKLIRRR